MKRNLVLFLLLIATISCNSQEKKDSTKEDSKNINLTELMKLENNQKLYAVIKTNMGEIEIELFHKDAPKTVKNFVGLASAGFYDGVIFHRVIKNFMIQGGDPTGTGRGGSSVYGGPFEDEFSVSLKHNKPGILSMANSGPNSNQSQFFITVAPTPWLDLKHTIFGEVVRGMEVVIDISLLPTDQMDKPISNVIMEKVTIVKK